MVTIALDATATGTGEAISKETDCHNGSEDGNGQFNWRFYFIIFKFIFFFFNKF